MTEPRYTDAALRQMIVLAERLGLHDDAEHWREVLAAQSGTS